MSGPSSYHRIFYQFAGATKGRFPTITPLIEETVRKIAFSKARDLGFHVLAINGAEDHMHMVVRGSTTLAPETIIRHVKGASSHFINRDPRINAESREPFRWQGGFGGVSVSPFMVKSVIAYVNRQKEHHPTRGVMSELEIDGEETSIV